MSADRARVVILFALSGAAIGVLFSMLFLVIDQNEYGRTHIEQSLPLTIFSFTIGTLVGCHLKEYSDRLVEGAVILGVLLLTVLLGGAFGWLIEAFRREHSLNTSTPPYLVTARGSFFGLLIGLLVLSPRWIKRRMRKRNKTT
jgi:hypothetical protein